MHDLALINDLAVIWLAAWLASSLCLYLKQPVIAGYVLVGIGIGPHGLGLIKGSEQIDMLADFGVAMLLFALGIDLSLKQVAGSAKKIIAAGTTQIAATLLLGGALAWCFGLVGNAAEGFLFGSVCALSSSVVISRMLLDRGELESIHGKILLPLSLVQDLSLVAIIPFLSVLPNGHQLNTPHTFLALGVSALKAILFTLIVITGATRVLPLALAKVARNNSKESFLLCILVLCLGISLISEKLGLSLALGAFLAGLMISESTYAHQALHDVSPLRDIFSTIFFVTIGMLLDPQFLLSNWLQVTVFVTLLIAGKATIGALAARLATTNLRSAILVGVGLSQVGEFSFVLLNLGRKYTLVNEAIYNLFFAGAIVSMVASPMLLALAARTLSKPASGPAPAENNGLSGHVIVCGYGRTAKNLGLILESYQIPFIVVELNGNIIEDLAFKGIRHVYGDAVSPLILQKAGINNAAAMVITMPDFLSVKAVTDYARHCNANLKIFARAHHQGDIAILRAAGINAVVQPEFEASFELTRLVLHSLERDREEINRALDQIKTLRYGLFQPQLRDWQAGQDYDDKIGMWFSAPGSIVGQTIASLGVREKTGTTITSIQRDGKTIAFPEPSLTFEPGDELYAIGFSEQIAKFQHLLEGPAGLPV